jgi:simple sugar transport system substrate-binding protein
MLRNAKRLMHGLVIAGTALAGALALGATDSAAQIKPASDVHIIFVTHGQANDSYWSVVKNGLQAAAKTTGAKVDYFAPETWDVVQMAHMIDAAVAAKPDGIVVTIPDVSALKEHIDAAKAAGIPVVVIDTGEQQVKDWNLDLWVGGGSEYDNGVNAGKLMTKAGVKSAVCINHEVGNVGLDERCNGFKDGLKQGGAEMKILAVTMDPTDSSNRTQAFLKTNPDVTGVLTLGPAPAGPILKMLRENGLLDKVKFGTFDLSPEVLDAVSKGEMMFGIDNQQFLMGYLPVVFLTLKAQYGTLPTASVWTGPAFVMKEDAGHVLDLSKQGFR